MVQGNLVKARCVCPPFKPTAACLTTAGAIYKPFCFGYSSRPLVAPTWRRTEPMPYQTADARREFDRWSRRYDRTWLQRYFFKPSHRMLLETLGDDDRDILDVGCGTGRFAARVLRHFPLARVWGLDLSDGMLGV